MDSSQGKPTIKESHPPDPSRFERYTLLPDESGFKIEGTDFTFLFDLYGGWYDEYGNYYNQDGVPSTPRQEDYYPEGDKIFDDYEDEDAERLVNEYDFGDEVDDEDEVLQQLDQIYSGTESKKRIANYLDNSPISIEFTNINYQATQEEFIRFIQSSGAKIGNCQFDLLPDKRRHKGRCVVTVVSKEDAYKLVSLSGRKLRDRPIKIQVIESDTENDDFTSIPTTKPFHERLKEANEKKSKEKNDLSSKEETKSNTESLNQKVVSNEKKEASLKDLLGVNSNGAPNSESKLSVNNSNNQSSAAEKKQLNSSSQTFAKVVEVSAIEKNEKSNQISLSTHPTSTSEPNSSSLKSDSTSNTDSPAGWGALPKFPKAKPAEPANKKGSK